MLAFPGHTPLHCAVLAHNSLLRDQGCQMLMEEQQKDLQHRSEELESCIHLLVQSGASIYSRVGDRLSYPYAVCFYGNSSLPCLLLVLCSNHRIGEGMNC